jgi:DNA-binding transcriptional LysR family regulator
MTLAKTANIKQLITFQKVARLGNVSLAAEELFLSQSATSIQLSNLEEAVGTKLLSRTGRGIRLTEAGEVLYTLCERVLNVWQEISDEMESYLGDFTGTLRIGAVTTAEYWLPHVLVNFANAHPKVKLKLQVANRDEVVRGEFCGQPDGVFGRTLACVDAHTGLEFGDAGPCPDVGARKRFWCAGIA